jgi:hypothetical protein
MTDQISFEVIVFDQGDAGELFAVGDPRVVRNEADALEIAKDLASRHSGVIALRRDSSAGPTTRKILYQAGEVIEGP